MLFFLPSVLVSQGSDLRGLVTDSTSNERIPYASVMIEEINKGAATNLNGFYLIPSVPPGVYTLRVSSIGYLRTSMKVYIRSGDATIVNVRLQPEPVEFSEVIVTEQGKRELTEINTSVHVLDQREIKMVPITLQEDVFRSIQILPGVVTTSDVNSHFYVRGGGGDQNLILLDGMRIYNPFHAFGIFSVFDPDIIKSTEVYTGAFPPGFGGRLSSVVNMTTREGKATSLAGKAHMNFLSAKLLVEGPLMEHVHWMASGRKSLFSNALDRFLRTGVPVSFYDGFIKVTRDDRGESHGRMGGQVFFSGDNLKAADPTQPDYAWRNMAAGFTAGGLIDRRIFVDVVGYSTQFEARKDVAPGGSQTSASTGVREIGVRANATAYTEGKDLFFFGFEFNFPTLDYRFVNRLGAPVTIGGTFSEASTWFRYQSTLGRWKVDGGLHIEIATIFEGGIVGDAVQPRVNVSYDLGDSWRMKSSFGVFGQKLITVNNEDDVVSLFDAWIKVPAGLRRERAEHIVVGLEGNPLPSLSTSLNAYDKRYSSLVTYNRDKVDAVDPDYINSTGSARGVEALVRYGSPLVDLYGSYTLGYSDIHSRGFTYEPRYARRHSVNLLGVTRPVDRVEVSLRWEFGSGFPYTRSIGYYDRLTLVEFQDDSFVNATGEPYLRLGDKNAGRLPSYHRLDASVVYRFTAGPFRGNVGFHVVNLYDHRNIFYYERKTGREVHMLSFFPSVNIQLEY